MHTIFEAIDALFPDYKQTAPSIKVRGVALSTNSPASCVGYEIETLFDWSRVSCEDKLRFCSEVTSTCAYCSQKTACDKASLPLEDFVMTYRGLNITQWKKPVVCSQSPSMFYQKWCIGQFRYGRNGQFHLSLNNNGRLYTVGPTVDRQHPSFGMYNWTDDGININVWRVDDRYQHESLIALDTIAYLAHPRLDYAPVISKLSGWKPTPCQAARTANLMAKALNFTDQFVLENSFMNDDCWRYGDRATNEYDGTCFKPAEEGGGCDSARHPDCGSQAGSIGTRVYDSNWGPEPFQFRKWNAALSDNKGDIVQSRPLQYNALHATPATFYYTLFSDLLYTELLNASDARVKEVCAYSYKKISTSTIGVVHDWVLEKEETVYFGKAELSIESGYACNLLTDAEVVKRYAPKPNCSVGHGQIQNAGQALRDLKPPERVRVGGTGNNLQISCSVDEAVNSFVTWFTNIFRSKPKEDYVEISLAWRICATGASLQEAQLMTYVAGNLQQDITCTVAPRFRVLRFPDHSTRYFPNSVMDSLQQYGHAFKKGANGYPEIDRVHYYYSGDKMTAWFLLFDTIDTAPLPYEYMPPPVAQCFINVVKMPRREPECDGIKITALEMANDRKGAYTLSANSYPCSVDINKIPYTLQRDYLMYYHPGQPVQVGTKTVFAPKMKIIVTDYESDTETVKAHYSLLAALYIGLEYIMDFLSNPIEYLFDIFWAFLPIAVLSYVGMSYIAKLDMIAALVTGAFAVLYLKSLMKTLLDL